MPDFTAGLVAAQRRWFLLGIDRERFAAGLATMIARQRMEWAALVANPGILRRH